MSIFTNKSVDALRADDHVTKPFGLLEPEPRHILTMRKSGYRLQLD